MMLTCGKKSIMSHSLANMEPVVKLLVKFHWVQLELLGRRLEFKSAFLFIYVLFKP